MITSTRGTAVERVLSGVIDLYTLVFPGRILACYVIGSVAAGTARWGVERRDDLSDVDVCLVFHAHLADREVQTCARVASICTALSPVKLDLFALSEEDLRRTGDVRVARTGRLIYGTDIADQLPPMAPETFLPEAINQFIFHLALLRRAHSGPLTPLTYPDPAGEFYGYDFRPDPLHGTPTLRLFVAVVCWAASIVVALRTGQCAASKGEAALLYRAHIREEWADFVGAVDSTCAEAWGYHVPEEAEARRHLRALCRSALAFEEAHLALCREYMMACVHGNSPDHGLWAMHALGRLNGHDLEAATMIATMDEETLRQTLTDATGQSEEKP